MANFGSTYDSGDPSARYDPSATNPEGTNGVYHDAQGRAYTLMPDGTRRYLASYQQAQQAAGNEGFFTNQEFNPATGQYERKIDWNNILGLAAGAEPFAAAGIAAAGAGGGVAGSAPTMGGGETLAANLGSGSALVGAPASLTTPLTVGGAGVGAGSVAPSAGVGGATSGAATAGSAAGLGGIGKALKDLGIPLGIAAAGKAMTGGFGGGDGGGSSDLPPELQQLLQLSMDRMRSQGPLFDAVNRQALAGLPTYAKGGQ